MISFDEFYELCESLPYNKDAVRRFCDSLNSIFTTEKCDYTSGDTIISLFYGNGSSISTTKFYEKRNLIIKFYEWLNKKGEIEQDVISYISHLKLGDVADYRILNLNYFKTLDDVIGYISEAYDLEPNSKPEDKMIMTSIAILAWHGLTTKEISSLKKGDLSVDAILVNNTSIEIKDRYYVRLKEFAEADVCKSIFDTPSKEHYLMRSKTKEQLSSGSLRKRVYDFNERFSVYGKKLSLDELAKNGIFCKIKELDIGNDTCLSVGEQIGCDRSVAHGLKELYEKWIKVFYEGREVG